MPDSTAHRSALPALWPFLLLCAGAAAWIDLGTLHRGFYADALLPVFNSLYRWSLFVWEQDRIGMLSGLLALPFKEPLVNLLVQDGFNVFCGLAAFFLLARYMLRDTTYPAVAALGAAAFVALPPLCYRYEFFINTFHSVWLALGLGGLVLSEPPGSGSFGWKRRTLALGLLVLAHWVYCTAALFLGPLVLFRSLFGCSCRQVISGDPSGASFVSARGVSRLRRWIDSELVISSLLLGIGFLAGLGLREYRLRQVPPPIHTAQFGALPSDEWWAALQGIFENTRLFLAPSAWPWWLAGMAGGGLVLLALPAVRREASVALRAAGALLMAAAIVTLFMATRQWVQMNLYLFRYILPCAFFVQAALMTIAVAPVAAALGHQARAGLSVLAALSLLLAAFYSYGLPSLKGVRIDLGLDPNPVAASRVPALLQPYRDDIVTDEVLAARCTHIAGVYWKIYPALFRVNQALCDRGERRTIWGLSDRCQPTFKRWKAMPPEDLCVAIPAGGDPRADYFFKVCGLPPLAVVERRSSVWILRPASCLLAEQAAGASVLRAEAKPRSAP